ncbi:MAG: hypothetical protein E7646_08630 [Ruminococcaceae bacterium]|nr:hypothetical protein [Oscillospiraceae bacterium]
MDKIKNRLTATSPIWLFVLMIMQPLLDVLSYWANKGSFTSVTTLLRFAMLVAVVAVSFVISNKKKRAVFAYGIIALLFVFHAISCFRAGGYSFVSDTANYLRIAQLPIFTFCFIDVFEACPDVKKKLPMAFFVIMMIIIAVLVVSFIVGRPEYTYTEYDKINDTKLYFGLQGWFEVGNCQSAIIVLIVPMILYYAFNTKNELFFALCAVLSFANLYLFGTRFCYYSIFIIALSFIVSMALSRQKRPIPYAVLAVVMIVGALMYSQSFMYKHLNIYTQEMSNRQDEINSEVGEIEDEFPDLTVEAPDLFPPESEETETSEGGSHSEGVEALRQAYLKIYEPYCKDMIEVYGMNRVIDVYDGTKSVLTLSDQRLKKINFAKLAWEDSSFDCRLFGFQYKTLVHGTEVYDLENDFQGTFYFLGYVGMSLFVAFLSYFVLRALMAIIRNPKGCFTLEFCVVGVTLILIVVAAQFSGNVLRRPNVSVYFSLFLAYIYCLTGRILTPKGKDK